MKRLAGALDIESGVEPFSQLWEVPELAPIIILLSGYQESQTRHDKFAQFLSYRTINKKFSSLVVDYLHENATTLPTHIVSIIGDDAILLYKNLINIRLHWSRISCECIGKMTHLQILDVPDYYIDDETLQKLTNLKSLGLRSNILFNGSSFKHLTSLTNLTLYAQNQTIAENLSFLSKSLVSLSLENTVFYVDDYIQKLTNLQNLSIDDSTYIDGSCFKYLTNLTSLRITRNPFIIGAYLSYLAPSLLSLSISGTFQINALNLAHLTSLTTLGIGFRVSLLDQNLTTLTSLKGVKFIHMLSYKDLQDYEKMLGMNYRYVF